MNPATQTQRVRGAVPLPPGASVRMPVAAADDPELLRHRGLLEAVCGVEFPFPGERYLPSTYVLVRLLRHLGCGLPVEVWHLGKAEMPEGMRRVFAELGAVCVDGAAVRRVQPVRRLAGWELKCFALLHSRFAEVLLLDADNCPVRDPAFLFTTPEYAEMGAIFWPDFTRLGPERAVWAAAGVAYREEWEFESGQIVVDKRRCWRALNVAMHLNEYSDWWYRLVHGDKETFHLAWRKIGQPYAMPSKPVGALDATMLQYDFAGRLLFQHRNFAKWKLGDNRHIVGFRLEKECLTFLADLRERWTPGLPLGTRRWDATRADPRLHKTAEELCGREWFYERLGLDGRPMTFLRDGRIGTGNAGCEQWWDVRQVEGAEGTLLEVFGQQGLTFRARRERVGEWKGAWVGYEKAAVRLWAAAGASLLTKK